MVKSDFDLGTIGGIPKFDQDEITRVEREWQLKQDDLNAKNKFYKYKSMPTELRIKHIENLQNQNGLKDKMGRVVGFNRVKKEIANKLYPKAQNSIRQHIDRLKELRGQLKMEEMYSNLAKEQPALESSIIRH